MVSILFILMTIIIIIIIIKYLEIEIEKMWGMNTTTISVIIGALGLVKKGMEKYISKIPGNISIQEAQKCVLLGTAHALRRILSIK